VLRHLRRLDPAPEHFPAVWATLTPQIESVQRIVARVDYNATQHKVAITFHSAETDS
jgi:hypothetical protein